jgi:hypothetical protein
LWKDDSTKEKNQPTNITLYLRANYTLLEGWKAITGNSISQSPKKQTMKKADFENKIKQAKNKSIINYLKQISYTPLRIKDEHHWFSSPLRPGDNKPSFKVNAAINKWYDFGTTEKGDIIDLVMRLERIPFSSAINKLNDNQISNFSSFGGPEFENSKPPTIQKIQPLLNPALIAYLKTRRIPKSLAKNYVKEVYYYIGANYYFSVYFQNDKGGFEHSNKYFKGAFSPKYYTTIPGKGRNLNIFEGVMDFLSCLVYFNKKHPHNTTIILNSLSLLEEFYPKLNDFGRINLYLDNDMAGERAKIKVRKHFPYARDWSKEIHPQHKDFNDFLSSIS